MSVTFRSLTNGIRFKKKESSELKELEEDSCMVVASNVINVGDAAMKTLRKTLGIRVQGKDVPDPLTNWWDLSGSLPEGLIEMVSSLYPNPTPIQAQSIPIMLQGRDVLGSAPTGSGKTAAYLLPILVNQEKNKLKTIILCPTRELSHQIHQEALKLIPPNYQTKVQVASSKKSNQGANVLISTPNTLVYLIKDGSSLDLKSLEWLIVDESDKLFEDKGKASFREQLAVVYKACMSSKKAFFSATLATDVENWCKTNLDNAVSVTIGIRNKACKDVKQSLDFERADELKEILTKQKKIKAEVIHSHRSLLQREDAIKTFRAGRTWVLICTELMSRGIDVKGVNLVINYDFPPSTVSYIHRVGRTGRAGRPGRAVTFFTDDDKVLLRSIAQIEKRRLASNGIERDSVKGESKYDKRNRLKREQIILASRKRKMKASAESKGEVFDESLFDAKFAALKKSSSSKKSLSKNKNSKDDKKFKRSGLKRKKRPSNTPIMSFAQIVVFQMDFVQNVVNPQKLFKTILLNDVTLTNSNSIEKENVVTCCCDSCTYILNWKIIEGSYIPIGNPEKCSNCGELKIEEAYHTRCSDCSEGFCAKCGKSKEIILSVDSKNKLEDILEEIKKYLTSAHSKDYLDALQDEIEEEDDSHLKDRKKFT
ncbi:DDX52 [Lepeophtheirus salmonis]|uniref:Probable ATP-dependent RNA helicase DDX52 n=1 Tax=Lepeophtheirus salmonis TaxID=72036 RepID=A0A7R8D5P3_LEPSM|nr:DDX52 [Lepeophtheirus salmonis]CAF3036295.1 DDX52 [Lepeophtheirus salmonis]